MFFAQGCLPLSHSSIPGDSHSGRFPFPPPPFEGSRLNAQTVRVATGSSSSGKGQLESPHPFSLFKGDSFSFYKRLGACAGLEVSSVGCGRLCCIPLREQSGEGSMAPQAGVQAVSPSPDGSVPLARVPKCEQAGRNTFPWGSGTSGQRAHVCPVCLAPGTRDVGYRCGGWRLCLSGG